jgi:hypothetical protein
VAHADEIASHRINGLLDLIAADLASLDSDSTDPDQLRRAGRHVDFMAATLAASADLDLVSLRDLDLAAAKLDVANGAMADDLTATLAALEEALDYFRSPPVGAKEE